VQYGPEIFSIIYFDGSTRTDYRYTECQYIGTQITIIFQYGDNHLVIFDFERRPDPALAKNFNWCLKNKL
jgi:hypothetical protein